MIPGRGAKVAEEGTEGGVMPEEEETELEEEVNLGQGERIEAGGTEAAEEGVEEEELHIGRRTIHGTEM